MAYIKGHLKKPRGGGKGPGKPTSKVETIQGGEIVPEGKVVKGSQF